MDKYKILKNLGDGTYGAVFKAENIETGEVVAIKKMKKKYKNWDDCMQLREVKSLRRMNHPNLVKLKEVVQVKDELQLVFEYIELNLYQFYMQFKEKKAHIPELLIKKIILQVALGLDSLHKIGYFHRDLKPENILINQKTFNVKVCDFGLAREVRCRPPFTEYVSTRWYRAPEILLHSQTYNSPIDIFALGCIMGELYNLAPLFSGANEVDQFYKMVNLLGTPQNWSEGMKLAQKSGVQIPKREVVPLQQVVPRASPDALQLLNDMLQYDSSKRPTALQIAKYPYFDDIIHEFSKQITLQPSSASQINLGQVTPSTVTAYPLLLSSVKPPDKIKKPMRQSIENSHGLQQSNSLNTNNFTKLINYSYQSPPQDEYLKNQSVFQKNSQMNHQNAQQIQSNHHYSNSNYHFAKQPNGLSFTQDVGTILGQPNQSKNTGLNFGGTLERPLNLQQYQNESIISSRRQNLLFNKKPYDTNTQMVSQQSEIPSMIGANRYPEQIKDATSYFNQFNKMQGAIASYTFNQQFNGSMQGQYFQEDKKGNKQAGEGDEQRELNKVFQDKLNWAF